MTVRNFDPAPIDQPLLLTVPDVIRYLGLSRSTVYALIQSGRLRSVKIGDSRRIPRQELEAFVSRLLVEQWGGTGDATGAEGVPQ